MVTEIPSSFSNILFNIDDQQDTDNNKGQAESDSSNNNHPDIFNHIS